MVEPRPSVTQFVNFAARIESAWAGDEREPLVAQRILMRLREQLAQLIGPAGVDALLGRSLVLARRTRPALRTITSVANGKLERLDPLAREASALDDSALSIVEHFVELLVTLVGEDLALGMLRDLWPAPLSRKTRDLERTSRPFGEPPAAGLEVP